MASGVSGRQSVSPSNDELYQSPGASQEDTIDHLLAHYGGMADKRPGEEGEGGVTMTDGGVENGAHRNRSTVVFQRPTREIVTSPTGAHPPRHFLTPSPRHAVSAPTSHRNTPVREEDPARQGGSRGHPSGGGMAGDTRSFSWDNVASRASSGTRGSGVNYPTTAAEIIELLQKKICFLSGGRAREGQSLITFPAKDKNFDYDRDELRRVIQYLASIPMEDVREYGFGVIVDARHSNWHSTKLVLHSLQEVLPGQVHVAYIIQPSHFWQKQATTRGHNKEKKKNRLEFSTIMLSEVDKLKRHIDPSQVTFDLGGYLPYNHDEWIKLRYDLERFIASFNALMEHTSHVEQQLHMQGEEGEGGDVETAEDALTRHVQIHDQLRKAPQTTIREGNELLRRLEQGRDEGGTSAMTPDKINAVSVIRRLLESVNRRQTQMDDIWRERRAVLEQTLELRVFEKAMAKVRGWLKARGEETLSSRSDIGEDLESAQMIHDQHNKFDTKAKSMYNNLTQLRRMADRFAGNNHFAADTLQRGVTKLSTKFSRFESHLGERRRIVVGSLRFHTSYKEWHTQSDHTVAILKEEVSAPDQTSAEQLLTEHGEVVSQLEELGLAVEKEGQDLLETMETVTRRTLENRASGQSSRPGPDYSGGIQYVESTLGEMRMKKHRVVQLAEARQLTLQQCKQLHNCESDARQVTKWLSDISEKLASSHGDIGTSKQAVEKLLNDHDKQTENAKKTYKYGCDLVSAAQRSRKSSGLEDSDSTDLLSQLAAQWEGLSAALVEARARLEVAQQFHHLADEVMECYTRWTTPIHQLPKTPPTVRAHLTDLSTNRGGFAQKITQCLKIGASLLDRMCRPLTPNPAYRNLNEPTKQSLAFLRSRLQEIERQTVDLEAVLSRQESVLKEFLVYCQFEHDMEQVLVWMQDDGLKSMQRFTVVGETHSTVQSQLTLFHSFSSACQEREEEVKRLVGSAPRQEAEISGFKSELTKKTQSLSAVWDKFSSRLAERERALRLAASFYDHVTKLQSLTGDLESGLSPEVVSLQSPLRHYLQKLSPRHSEMTALFRLVSEDGAALTEMFKPTGETAGDSGRLARISAQISNLETHCQRVEQLWSDAWGRDGGGEAGSTTSSGRTTRSSVSGGQPTRRGSGADRTSGKVAVDEAAGSGARRSERERRSSKSSAAKPSQASTVATPSQTSQTTSEASAARASPTAQTRSTKASQPSTAQAIPKNRESQSKASPRTSTSETRTAKAVPTAQAGKPYQTSTSVTVQRGSGGAADKRDKSTGRVGHAVQILTSPTSTQPPTSSSAPTTLSDGTSPKSSEPRTSLRPNNTGAPPTTADGGAKRLSDTFGDLEAEAYKHLERLESECSRFHSSHCEMGDDPKTVSELHQQYLKFLAIVRPTCSSIEEGISSLQALQSGHSPHPSPSLITGVTQLCEGLRKRVGWWRGGFTTLADTLDLFLSFSKLSSKVNSDLQALEDSFCETIDLSISMEAAQEMLERYQPHAAALRENYPSMKQLGEKFLETTSKMAAEKTAPELSVGGACISVAVEMGGVEGRYPEALEVWSRRERQLQQSLEWHSFRQNIEQLSSWMKTASESFLVRFDLGTSLVTTEDLEMEFQEFKARAQLTTKEVELALAQSEKMLGESHFAAASLRELSWNLRELLEDFTARTREREKTLHEAADFFRAADKLQNDMKDVIARCKDSPSIVTIRKETALPSVSYRLVNLQTAGTNLVSLGEGRKKGSVRGRKRKLIRSDSSGATEFSLKQTLSGLQLLYAEYKTALEGRKVTTEASVTRQSTVRKEKTGAEKREGETERKAKETSPAVVLRRKERSGDHRLKSGDISVELKRNSWSFQRREGVQLTSRWENRDSNKKLTVESRSAARVAVKSEKLYRGFSEDSLSLPLKRSYTLPGHFRGWRAPGLSVLEKAAAFSRVTEGTGLAAPYGLHSTSNTSSKRTRRPSLDGREFDTKKSDSKQATVTFTERLPTSPTREKTVGKPPAATTTTSSVQAAVVKTVISVQEPVKRVSLIDIDVPKPHPTPTDSDPSSGRPLTRVVSPSSQVLPSEQEAPPRVVSPEPSKPKTTATPVTLSSSKSLKASSKNTRRSIQNLRIAGKVTHLKQVFDRQEEEISAESAEKPTPNTTSSRAREMDGRLSPDIVPKVSEMAELADGDAALTMADRPIPSPDITPKETSFPTSVVISLAPPGTVESEAIVAREERATVKTEVEVRVETQVEIRKTPPVKEEETAESLAPRRPEFPPQSLSPEVKTPPPRPPSPIGYILEDSSDGESSYQSYDTEYSDDDEEEEEEEEEGEEVEDVDSGSISRRTVKTLQAVTVDLMSQELSYLHSLKILTETYLPSLTKPHVPSFVQGRGLKIFSNVSNLYEVHRTFYTEVSSGKLDTPPAIVESFCTALVRGREDWNQYQTYLLNMEQGQRILSQYGGTFFQEIQASIGDHHTLVEHFVRPRDQLVRYDRILKDLVMCAQKEYLHGVGIAKDALRVIQNILHATNNAMAMAKLRGCPISLDKTSLLMAEEFNMYTTEKKKVVREMVVFLDRQFIIFAVDLMGGKEYDYWEHIETTDLHLMETYKAKEDRFALSPGPPTSAHYIYVLQPLSADSGIKIAWVDILHFLLRQGARDSLPLHEAILPLPYHFRKTDLYQEGDGGTLKRQGSLKRSLSLKKKKTARETGKEAPVNRSDPFGNKKELVIRRTGSLKRNKRAVNEPPPPPEIQLTRQLDPTSSTTAEDSYLYVVVEDFSCETEGFLSVRKGQLVEVLDQGGGGGGNWLVVALASAPGDLEDEGFLPARCLQPASKMGVSRPSSVNTESRGLSDKTTPHSSHDQLKYPTSDRGSHDTSHDPRASAVTTASSKRGGRSQQFTSMVIEDIYYSNEDTPQSPSNEGLLSLTYGQSVEILDVSGGDLWLVKTTDTTAGKTAEGLVKQSWLSPKPPPPRKNIAAPVQSVSELHRHQNGDIRINQSQPGRDPDKVQLRGHPPPISSALAAVLPGTLFGVYEPPKSMIFGKPEVNEGDIPTVEESIKQPSPTTKQAPPMILEQAPTPLKSEDGTTTTTSTADDELQRLQVASVNSQVQLDNFDPVEIYVAIADFEAAEESNISLRAGERVQLVDSSRSDWWLVSLPQSGQSGWVPADYLEKKTLGLEEGVTSPRPEPFTDEAGEIERVLKRGHRLSQIQLSRHRLYQSPFLATPPNTVPEEPTPAQMEGVFSISVPYVAMTEILGEHANQLSLVKDQPVRVLDCHRDDWWLVQTIPDLENRAHPSQNGVETGQNWVEPGQNGNEPEQNEIFSREGWVPANLLQPSHTDFTSEGGPKSAPPFATGASQPRWVVLADYPGEEEGTVRVWQGDLVEVIDISRNEWCLIRPVLRSEEAGEEREEVGEWEEEGWVPAGFLKPYSGGGFAYPFPQFPPHMSPDDESDEEGAPLLSGDETEPLALTPEPNLTPYPDPERRAEATKKRSFIVSELVSTEKDYVAKLEFCVQNYIKPAQGATAPKPLQTAELFAHLVQIYEFHRDHFHPRLEGCQSQPEDLGSVFTSSEESLQVYVAYCKAKAASHALLQEHKGFFEELRGRLADRLELADYLILPVSRITKCSLLLSDFRKQSARSALSAGQVDEALEVTRGISRQANNAIHLDMLQGLSKMEVGGLVLLDTFHIQAGSKPGSKQRQVFLFPECLLIAKRERGRCYSVKDKLMLRDISMAPDMDPQKKNLIIYDMNSGTKFTLTAAKSTLREQWLTHAQKLIQSAKADTSGSAADSKTRAASEPPELAQHSPGLARKVTALKNSLVAKKPSFRLGSTKQPSSSSTPSALPASNSTTTSSETSDEPVEGTEYVVMECIVLEGGDDVQLGPGEVVTLVRVEGGGASLRVRTTDAHPTEGTLPATFLRKKTTSNGVDMEAAPKFTMLPSDLDLLYGTTATIACAFNGFPKPSVEWRMNRQTLTSADDDRVKITSCATSSILEIIKLCYEDVGTYACFITNSGGSNSAHMSLNVHGPPAKVGKPGVSKVTGTSVKLKWSPPEVEGGSPITTYQVEMLQEGFEDWQPIIQQPKTMFIVKALQPSTSYQFRVLACNQYGAGQPSDPSDTVTTKGRGWLSSSPSNSRKKEGTDYTDSGGGGQGMFDDLAGEEGSGSNIMSPPAQFIRRGSIHSEYDVLPEELGRGRFGIIHKCVHRGTGIQMVAKYVRLRSRKKAEIRREVEICRKVTGRSPYIMEFHDAFERGKNLVIVTELVPGGELIERILEDNDLTEGVVVRYLSHLLAALDTLHQMNIAHLDIKPENLLVSGVEENPIIKLIDFGSAQELNGDVTPIASSSPEFSAPEVICQEGPQLVSDMWSVGVLTYILLSGTSPFFSENAVMVVDRIKEARYDFYKEQFEQISTEAKEFISALLQKSPDYRMTASQALRHDWVTTLLRVSVHDSVSPWPMARIDTSRLKAFNARRKWHTTAVATDATAVFGPRSAVFSPIPPDFEELLGKQELPPSLYPDSDVDVNAARGSTVSFQFQVSGQPEPNVVWERGSQRLGTDDRVVITSNEGVTTLAIHEVTREDAGLYVCCAMNHLGNTVQECKITLLEPPAPPTEVNGVILGSYNSALVSWLSVSGGPCPITRYLLQLRQTDSSSKSWTQVADDITSTAHVVENLERGVAYVFRVCAMNEVGCGKFSQASPPLTITDEPDYDSDGPEMEDVRRIIQPLALDSYLSSLTSSSHQ